MSKNAFTRKLLPALKGLTESFFGRVSLGVSAMAAAVFGSNPAWGEFNAEKFFAFVSALTVWLLAEFFSKQPSEHQTAKPSASDHDANLYSKFLSAFSTNSRMWLKHQDFHGKYYRKDAEPFFEHAAIWEGARYEFDDQNLQSAVSNFNRKCEDFIRFLALNSTPIDKPMGTSQVVEFGPDFEPTKNSKAAADFLNKAATDLLAACEEVYRTGRQCGLSSIEQPISTKTRSK